MNDRRGLAQAGSDRIRLTAIDKKGVFGNEGALRFFC
jgi:hypothetical protein